MSDITGKASSESSAVEQGCELPPSGEAAFLAKQLDTDITALDEYMADVWSQLSTAPPASHCSQDDLNAYSDLDDANLEDTVTITIPDEYRKHFNIPGITEFHEDVYLQLTPNADEFTPIHEIEITSDSWLAYQLDHWPSEGEAVFLQADPRLSHQEQLKQAIIQKQFGNLTKEEEQANAWSVKEGMTKELQSWVDLSTIALIPRREAQNVIDARWILTWKNVDGKRIVKARLCLRGFKDDQADVVSTFAGTASRWSQRLIASISAQHQWPLLSADIGTAFLRGMTFKEMSEFTGEPLREVCLDPPAGTEHVLRQFPGFEHYDPARHVLKLVKPAYGLKDAPRAWRLMLDVILTKLNGHKMICDRQIYMWRDENNNLVMVASTHVDDLKVTGDRSWINWLFAELEKKVGKLTVKDGNFEHCGIEHSRLNDGTVIMSQDHYASQLKPIRMPKGYKDTDPVDKTVNAAFLTLLGGLSWLCLTRYDISIYVCALQRASKAPQMQHASAANRLFVKVGSA